MKKLSITAALALAAIFSAFSAQAQSDYTTAVKNTPNLLGYWRFSSASQANSEVNGYTGTFMGNAAVSPAHSGPSLIGDTSNSAVLLDGITGYVRTNLTGQIDQQGSMIGWFKLSSLPSTAGHPFVIADASNFGNDLGLGIDTDNTLKFYTDSGSHTDAPDAFTAADLNTWHFVAVTFKAGNDRNVYLDGKLVGSNVPGVHTLNTGDTFAIGESIAFPGRFFKGTLDEIAVFNRELTATEVANIYAVATPRKLLNIATRMRVQTGENVLIGGFIITGTDPKKVIVRAIGPSLSQFFSGVVADTTLEVHSGNGTLLASNDNWKTKPDGTSQQAEIEATGIPPSNDLESAVVITLPANNAGYTAIVRGKNDTTGIGVVEAYDLDQAANSKLANIATRGFVESGDNVMIGGLIIGPSDGASAQIVVRAIGPSLSNFGISGTLQDPTLDLVDSNGVIIRSNDNWKDFQQAAITAAGLAPSDDRESALVQAVAPGSYTAIVRGKGSTTGVGLVEVYNVP